MTKLLYITNGINGSGGLERVLSVKASYLAEHYHYEVHILVLNGAHQNPFYAFSPNVQFHSIAVKGNPISYFKRYRNGIQKIVQEIQPDIISVCDDGFKGFYVPRLLKTKAKIIYERHASIQLNTNHSLKGKLMRFLMQRQASTFSKFVVLTQGNVKEWKAENVIVIPNPLSFESREENPLNQKRIIAVGSHSLNKGYDRLLKIWQKIELNFPDWELAIYGKIDADKTFAKTAEEMDLKNVHFHAPVQNIQSEYEQSAILVLPSHSEGFGMVLIEAMECGVPCVAFDCPSGPADIINHQNDGFLVENGHTKEFEDRLQVLMKDHDLRKRMGAAGRENVKRYLPETVVKQWDELFKKLIKN